MSTTIDSRVVEMRFDNKQFESNVQTSLSTLDKLKSSLNMNGAVKGFEELDSAAKKVNMNGLGEAVETVKLKFSALEVMAVTALSNITTKALQAGAQVVSSLTIDPIKMGFSEYETQINAIQTILANTESKGSTLEDVNTALDELNTYADKTIYNFTEMTRNIGTFTAAGVDLDTSVQAIKGIANLAAVSGSTSQQASTAMYQLSQALASGTVKLMDWNSVVNAGMGGQVFQDALKETARVHGIAIDEMIESEGSFRETLSEGWLTSEILTETLAKFTGDLTEEQLRTMGYTEDQIASIIKMGQTANDAATKVKTFTQLFDTLKEAAQSGWTQSWEIIVGDFEEAKELLTEISDIFGKVIGDSAEARNNVLQEWKDLGGRDDLIESFRNIFEGVSSVISAIKEAFEDIFPSGTIEEQAARLKKLTGSIAEMTETFKKLVAPTGTVTEELRKIAGTGVNEYIQTFTGMSSEAIDELMALGETAGYDSEEFQTLANTLAEGSTDVQERITKLVKAASETSNVYEMLSEFTGMTAESFQELHKLGETAGYDSEAFRELASSLAEGDSAMESLITTLLKTTKVNQTIENLKNTFKGLFAIVSIVKQAFSALFTAISPLFGGVSELSGGILGLTGSIGEWLVKLDESIKVNDTFGKAAEKVADVLQKVIDTIRTVLQSISSYIEPAVEAIKEFIKSAKENFEIPGFELFHNLLERVQTRMAQVGEAAGSMKSGVVVAFEIMGEALANCEFVQILQTIWNAVKTIASSIVNALGSIGGAITSSLGEANFSGIIDLLNGISFGAIAVGITKFVGGFRQAIDEIGSIKESFIGILDSVRGCFEAYQTQLQAGTLLKIASAIAILAASLITLSLIDSEKLNSALGGITVLFADLMVSMAVFNKISGQASGVTKSVTAMLGIATSVLILASALKKIGDLDTKQLITGVIGIAGLTTVMVAAAKVMSSGGGTIVKGATQMVIFAAAIKVLASVCEDLSALSWEELAKGLVGVGVLLAEVSLFMNTAKFSGKSITTATGIVILAAAIKVLASACEDFGGMKWEEIAKGLVSIGALLAEIALFTNLTGNAKHVLSTGVALIAIAASMKIFASVVQDFGSMSWEEIAKGLVTMAGALTAVTVAVNFMPKNMVGIGTGLIAVAAALVVMANALNKMSSMTWEEIAKGLVTLGGAMAILAIGLNAMTGTLAGSAAMLVAAGALLVMTPVLSILGAMSWTSIAKGLVALAGAFTVIGVAGLVLTPLVPTILGLSGAFALIGVSVLGIGAGLALAGAGLSALAVGLTALATAGTAGATAIVASLTVIITGVAALIPAIAEKLGEAVVAFCQVLIDGIPAIGEAIKAIVLTIVDVLVECVPAIADGALKLIAGVLEALVEYTPSIVDSIFQFLIGVLEGIARNLPGLIQAAIDVLMSFFSGIVDALKGIDTETLLQGIVGIGLLSAIMAALSAVAALVPGAMVGVLGMGAVIAELAIVLAAVGALAQIPGLEWLINEGGDLLQSVGTAIGKFIGGIVGGFASGVSSQFPQIATDLSGFMTNIQPFVQGAAAIDPSMMDGVKALAETILVLTAANILDGITSWLTGGSSLTGFAEDLVPFGKAMKQFSIEIAGIDGETIANAAIAGKTLAEMAATLPNSGGVVGWFTGENDMNAFGEQLIPFGQAMKSFGDEVAGLNSKVITEAATAGKALAEMATTVPNSGGVVGFFAGENDMDAFGEQLVPFGKAMKEYGIAVSGIKADVIQNSVTAGQALIELANTVPNTGGAVSWFTGDNDLTAFGEQLVPFGKAMKNYSIAVTGLDASVVTNSANAAKALVELSNNLPNTGGVVSWFTGDNDIASFGEQLVSFGQSFASYYNSVSGVDTGKLNSVVTEFRNLVDLATGIKSVDTSGMSNFASNLKKLGNSGIDEFINAFTNANSRVTSAATTMVNNFATAANSQSGNLNTTFTTIVSGCLTAIKNKASEFNSTGQTLMTNFISGVKSKDSATKSAFTTIVSGCLTAIKNKASEFEDVGELCITKFIAGVKSKDASIKDTFTNSLSAAISSVKDYYDDFYDAGEYLVKGFAKGIDENTWRAKAKAAAMAKAAAKAAEDELDINSPSKVGYKIGGFFGLGFVNSLIDYADKSYEAGSDIAASAKEGLARTVAKIGEFIDSDMDTEPTIRPILDLSDVQSKASQLTAILSRTQASKIAASMSTEGTGTIQNGDSTTPVAGNTYSFTQNNYSPKALSRVEIYRQTKNQFSAMERMVNA